MAGKQTGLGSVPLRLSFFFNICGLWTLSCDFVDCLLTLSFTVNETLRWQCRSRSGGDTVVLGIVSLFPSTSRDLGLKLYLSEATRH